MKRDWIIINVYALLLALPIMSITLYCSYYLKYDAKLCNNITFISLALSQLRHAFNLSSRNIAFINNEITRNKFTWIATLLCIIIMGVFYFVSPLNKTIGLQKLSANRRFIVAMISISPIFLIQLFKRGFKILD